MKTAYVCSHVVAVLHAEEKLDVNHRINILEPIKGRGRPLKRTGALETMDPNAEFSNEKRLKTLAMHGQEIYHPEYGIGLVGRNHTNSSLTEVWTVMFNQRPGGADTFEMTAEEVLKAHQAYKAFKMRLLKEAADDEY
jgi:hypothetical protein